MTIEYEKLFLKQRAKIEAKKLLEPQKIDSTIEQFENDIQHVSLSFKKITCKYDKFKHSIRIGNTGYRILMSIRDKIAYFQQVIDHDKYDRLTKDC